MARLLQSQVNELIRAPKNAKYIEIARNDEARIIMHTEPVRNLDNLPMRSFDKWLEWVGTFLPADKLARFKQLVTTPLDTIESTKGVFDELSKFLDAQDKYIKFELSTDTLEEDFNEYLGKLGDNDFWRTKGFDKLKTSPNSFLIVDLAAEQTTTRPEPYYFFVDIWSVHDVDIDQQDGDVEYLIYTRPDGKFVVLDDEFFRLVSKGEGDILNYEIEAPHTTYTEGGVVVDGLGYTPACSFFDIPMYNTRRISKRGPISDTVGKLDWLLFWRVSKRYLDAYGAYPITVAYKSTCNYRDANGNECNGGYINYQSSYGAYDIANGAPGPQPQNLQMKCPACSARDMIGPGSYWEVDAPADSAAPDMMINPVKFVEMPNDKLEYGTSEAERLENEIYLNCVGSDGNAMNKQAVNENQVQANFESKEAILDRLKTQFERAHKFGIETVCRLRYGQYYTSGVVDYGNEFFLKSVDDLQKQYKDAKDNGMPMFHLATLREQITRTRFKNNPEQLQRDYILSQIEPWLDLSLAQCTPLAMIDPEMYTLKINFTTFIQQFEREQTNIVEFGSLIPFKQKISLITNKLLDYVRERRKQAAGAQPDTGGNGPAPGKPNGGPGKI